MIRLTILGALLAATALPAIAQPAPAPAPTRELPYDRGYDKDTARGDAINAREAPVTADLNTRVDAATAVATPTLSAKAQYAADMELYRARVQANRREVMRDDVRYARQQRAYADAMVAWRLQASDCLKGRRVACNAPTPDPAAFY